MRRLHFVPLVLLGFFAVAVTPRASAEEAQSADQPKPVELIITPQAVESPILKYRLHPTEPELVEGDAAPILLRLPWEETKYFSQEVPKLERWVTLPLDHPDWKESRGVLPLKFYGELKRAAFRRDAHWEYPLHEEPAYEILLPDIQGAREIVGRGLSARIRYHILNREYDKAREGIAVGLGISRHYGRTPFVITQLVVATIQRLMLDRVEELIAAEGSPNLYWALSTLPRPMIDLRPSSEFEERSLEMTIPELTDLDRPRTPQQWRDLGLRLARTIQFATTGGTMPIEEFQRKTAALARQELPRLSGAAADKVAAMSDEEAGIRWYMHHHQRHVQQAVAIQVLPPREALPLALELQQHLAAFSQQSGIPTSAIFDPLNVYIVIWSTQRRIDALRVVEAIRHHTAVQGRLPESLDDVRELSLPLDPLLEKPFEWSLADGIGTLTAPKRAGIERPSMIVNYRIRTR